MSAERDDRDELSEEMLAALRREALGQATDEPEVEERGAGEREESRPRLTGPRKGRPRGKRLVLPREEHTLRLLHHSLI